MALFLESGHLLHENICLKKQKKTTHLNNRPTNGSLSFVGRLFLLGLIWMFRHP